MKIHNFRGDLSDISALKTSLFTYTSTVSPGNIFISINVQYALSAVLHTVKLFSKFNNYFFGYFDPINIFFNNQNKILFGVT